VNEFTFNKGKHTFISEERCYLSEISGETKDGIPTGKRVCSSCAELIDLNDPNSVSSHCGWRMNGAGWHIPYFPLFK
jgi:hypothetical protein